jgi:hypothetical protein
MRRGFEGLPLLRACESIDCGRFRHESNQGLRTVESVEIRIDSQTLRQKDPNRIAPAGVWCVLQSEQTPKIARTMVLRYVPII